jgi:hypothetical protein
VKPQEFVSRVIDLFDFNMGSVGWDHVRPVSFASAALCIRLADGDQVKVVNGYTFKLEGEEALGHVVIRATMSNDACSIRGAVCFTFLSDENISTLITDSEKIFGTWQVTSIVNNQPDEVVSMLSFLALKTNNHITNRNK